jgi:hypothetical protein
MVLDLTESALLPTNVRELLAAHRRWLFAHTQGRLLGECVVVKSRSEQEFFTVGHDDEATPPQYFFQTLDDAIQHGANVLGQRGIVIDSIPPRSSTVRIRPLRKAVRPLVDDTPAPPRALLRR